MSKKCQIDNCPCCFHKEVNQELKRPMGRPRIQPIDENHRRCNTCEEVKEMSLMRKNRNICLECFNKSQREHYKKNDYYKKYKLKTPKVLDVVGASGTSSTFGVPDEPDDGSCAPLKGHDNIVPDDINLLADEVVA